jgi:large conductance mechanosensitive channel
MLKEFREFIARGNVLDLAVAVIIGAAFGRIVSSLVEGVLMPPIGQLLGRVDFSSLFWIIDSSRGVPTSLVDAKAKAVPVVAYGAFLNEVVNFFIIAFVIFMIVRQASRFKKPSEPIKKDCPYCLTSIPIKARRCAACCADLAGT